VKRFLDAEARVIGHQEGTGRHRGRLGALLVELPNGARFAVGTGLTDGERSSPPPIGSLITFRYQELSDRGIPRFPSFVGVRVDAPQSTLFSSGEMTMATMPAAKARRFELSNGTSRKFWEISSNGLEVHVRFGRIGTEGQCQVKSFHDRTAASKHVEKMIQAKTAKGYTEIV